jgi:acetyltransferase-like isoleucine patch superfamily enzyme
VGLDACTLALTMAKSFLRRASNRILQLAARIAPGSVSLRPLLHRWRGVSIGKNVFIGDDVYLENEYPECVEIQDNVSISMRAVLIAHTRGPGKLVLEKDSFVGPNAVVCCSAGQEIRIGAGAVVAAGAVVTRSVPAQTMIAPPPSRAVAHLKVPLTSRTAIKDFRAGMSPISPSSTKGKK